jgi:predicted transcriptional regulator
MATATSIKLDDELKGRAQHLADTRRRHVPKLGGASRAAQPSLPF